MKIGEEISGIIEDLSPDGEGFFRNGTKLIHVRHTIPGDEVSITLSKRKKGTLWGTLNTITTPSADRIAPPCPHASTCGGCSMQAFQYEKQCAQKVAWFNTVMAPHGIQIHEITPSPTLWHYRNKMDFAISEYGEVGLKESGTWWKYIDLRQCDIFSPDTHAILSSFREFMHHNHVEPWNIHRHTGCARYLVIRESKTTKERMIIMVTSAQDFPREAFIAAMQPWCTSLYHGINDTMTDLSYAHTLHHLTGTPSITEHIGGISYEITPNAFFQANSRGAHELMETVMTAVGTSSHILDLYCGSGFFSLPLAKLGKHVHGVELSVEAVEAARRNAQANTITSATFEALKTEDSLPNLIESYDCVILDPPRSGLHPTVITWLSEKKFAKIVYVSCNYKVLARELEQLTASYNVTSTTVLDMFPHTPHMEVVMTLEKRSTPPSH